MFTGIISDVGTVVEAAEAGDLRVRISCRPETADAPLGASIACSGVCLTVVDAFVGKDGGEAWFAVDVSAETRSRTAPLWAAGQRVNLERSLKLGDELGGHIVTGHVDAVGEVESVATDGGSLRLSVIAPAEVEAGLATKGSVALDGVSLTVNEVESISDGVRFTVNIIPHTAAATSLADVAAGRRLNIEIDVLARYIGRLVELRR